MWQRFFRHRTIKADRRLFAVMLVATAFGSCSFEEPQAPKWDAALTIPLINRYYTMDELIEDEPSLSADSAGLLHYLYDTELDSFRVGNQLTFEEFSDSYLTSIGQLSFDSPGGANLSVSLPEIYPDAVLFNGLTVVVPPFDFDLGKRVLSPYDEFEWLEVATGTIRLLLNNNLVVTLGRPLHFAIYDTEADTLVATADFDGEVGPGETLNQSIDLAGKKFSNELSVEISGSSPGSNNQPVLIDITDSFNLNVRISDLQVAAARARIGSQEVTDSQTALIDEGASISSAKIKQGLIHLEISSQLPLPATIVMTMPDFTRPDNSIVTEIFNLNDAGTTSRDLDFTGYTFAPEAAPLGQQTVKLLWSVQSPGSGNNYVTVQSTDEVSVTFSIEDMIFSEVSGSFTGKSVQVDPQTYSVDVPNEIDSLNFEDVQLEMRLRNGIGFPAQIDLLLEGASSETGRSAQMRIQEAILSGGLDGSPVETRIVLDRSNSNVNEFLNVLPTSIRVSGTVTLGGAGVVGTVRDRDAVTGVVNIDAPLAFSLPAQRVEMESESVEIDEEAREQIRDNLHNGALLARLTNHLPMGASISFYFGRSKAEVFTEPILVIGPATAAAPDLEVGTGAIKEAKLSEVTISLSEAQLKIFDTTPLFAGVLVDFPGTGGQVVRLVRTDYIDIKAVATINFTVAADSFD